MSLLLCYELTQYLQKPSIIMQSLTCKITWKAIGNSLRSEKKNLCVCKQEYSVYDLVYLCFTTQSVHYEHKRRSAE
jgi:hypothetical protein